jgi:hypothetical protein
MKALLACVVAVAVFGCGDDDGSATSMDAGSQLGDASVTMHASPQNPCGIDSGWRGDDQCVPAPKPSEGFQLHFGPKRYDDKDEIARYTLGPGEEKMLCTYIITPNDTEVNYDTWLNRLRPGSHHMIVTSVAAGDEAAGIECAAGDGAGGQGIIGGNTTTVKPLDDIAPENQGFAHSLAPHTRVSMQLHFFNAGDEPLLMEAWQNIYYKDKATVKGVISPLESIAGLGMNVKPGTTEVIAGSLVAPSTLRVLDLYSHNHDHTLRFSAYLKRNGETERTLIYESYDWEHALLLPLDSIHKNAKINQASSQAGGTTGQLELQKGDALEFECEIRNDDLEAPLKFANEAHTAEMCILRGDYAPSLGRAWSGFSL